jgi:hypothetical protein
MIDLLLILNHSCSVQILTREVLFPDDARCSFDAVECDDATLVRDFNAVTGRVALPTPGAA